MTARERFLAALDALISAAQALIDDTDAQTAQLGRVVDVSPHSSVLCPECGRLVQVTGRVTSAVLACGHRVGGRS